MSFPIIDPAATGNKIKKLLKENGYGVEKIKDMLGMSNKSSIYKWFRGETLPSLDNLLVLSELLSVSINELIVTNKAA